MTCTICKRTITDPESVRRGIGPICAARRKGEGPMLFESEKAHRVRGEFVDDIVMSRDPDGVPVVNIEQTHELHSPTGFEWGYGGSGPADLALNILARYVDTATAHQFHQSFKADFVSAMPREGGIISGARIREWLAVKRETGAIY
jgi:hypothetical protein